MTGWKDNRKFLNGEGQLSALDAQLEVINAEANNLLGVSQSLATEFEMEHELVLV